MSEREETFIELPDGCSIEDVIKLSKTRGWTAIVGYLQARITMTYLEFDGVQTVENLKFLQGCLQTFKEIIEIPEVWAAELENTKNEEPQTSED